MGKSLTAVVLTKNSSETIVRCLKSLVFVDQIVVIDNGSDDGSVSLTKELGARVKETKKQYFDEIRNESLDLIETDWVLYIDDDEVVSRDLRNRIEAIVSSENGEGSDSYKIYRKNIMLGKWLKHGGWWPDPAHRLFKTKALKKWEGRVHEHPVVTGDIGQIEKPIEHYSKDSVSEMLKNSIIFGKIEAKLMTEHNHPPIRVFHVVTAVVRTFWYRGIRKMGWLDGYIGLILIMFQTIHQVILYTFLWEEQNNITNNKK